MSHDKALYKPTVTLTVILSQCNIVNYSLLLVQRSYLKRSGKLSTEEIIGETQVNTDVLVSERGSPLFSERGSPLSEIQ